MALVQAFATRPSQNRPGFVNVLVPGKGWLSVDPGGNQLFDPTPADGNYQQFKREGFALSIAPGDDNDPTVPTFTFIPE